MTYAICKRGQELYLGAKQREALDFCRKYPDWSSYDNTVKAIIQSLAKHGLVEDSAETMQFRAKQARG